MTAINDLILDQPSGKQAIDSYLLHKHPYLSCGFLLIDLDGFHKVLDVHGSDFCDRVLSEVTSILLWIFDSRDILLQVDADEFAVLVADISQAALVQKVSELLHRVRSLSFPENEAKITCSIGVCLIPENVSGFTYRQLFANADWALHRAKDHGRNRYEICDSLLRFEENTNPENAAPEGDLAIQQANLPETICEIFEKTNHIDTAIQQVLKRIGRHFGLDRITVIRTDVANRTTNRLYQWLGENIPEALSAEADFEKEDFLTLFEGYDSHGTTVLQYDQMTAYSDGAVALLMQGDAKTVLYASLYCEGKYMGAISYVTCTEKREWNDGQRTHFGILTKVISAHLAKHMAIHAPDDPIALSPAYDSLTGLSSFSKFRDQVQQVIDSRPDREYIIVYTDFCNFNYLNQKFGYHQGDYLLRNFTSDIIASFPQGVEVFFSRVISDQFVLCMPYADREHAAMAVHEINMAFVRKYSPCFPGVKLSLRSGIYFLEADCSGASSAIDAANHARQRITESSALSACLYDKRFRDQQMRENEIINGMEAAMENGEFQVYLQPKFSLKDSSIIGAEALVRWIKPDGTLLPPDAFIPIYERTGKIAELDFYVFEKTVEYLAKNNALGRRQVPISINASMLHATDRDTVQRYLNILKKYDVDPALAEVELTETASVSDFSNVVQLFGELQNVRIRTSLDDFGAGYSVLNSLTDIPVNTVKLDRAFIMRCESSGRGIFYLNQIISMIKGLGYQVLCEGVETDEQVRILREAGCEEAQGYWFSRPVPMADFERLMYEA